jgi:hypothetical protein
MYIHTFGLYSPLNRGKFYDWTWRNARSASEQRMRWEHECIKQGKNLDCVVLDIAQIKSKETRSKTWWRLFSTMKTFLELKEISSTTTQLENECSRAFIAVVPSDGHKRTRAEHHFRRLIFVCFWLEGVGSKRYHSLFPRHTRTCVQ